MKVEVRALGGAGSVPRRPPAIRDFEHDDRNPNFCQRRSSNTEEMIGGRDRWIDVGDPLAAWTPPPTIFRSRGAPVGGPPDQPTFLNGAALVETTLAPEPLLAHLQQIETAADRRRTVHWGPRTLDLDLLFYDDRVFRSPTLTLPHPRAGFRKFVL